MAAPLRHICRRTNICFFSHSSIFTKVESHQLRIGNVRCFSRFFNHNLSQRRLKLALLGGAGLTVATGLFTGGNNIGKDIRSFLTVCQAKSEVDDSAFSTNEDGNLIRSIKGSLDLKDHKFTLYQFHSCPYCCKVRAALDYFGFSYDIVEVNSVTKKQIKFSAYKKVPILVLKGKDEKGEQYSVQFYDSSLIVSALASFMYDPSTSLLKLHSYFPAMKEKEGRKTVWDFPNKYFIMYGDNVADSRTEKQRSNNSIEESEIEREERKWRRWTDDILMHTISPNVYHTFSESLEAFHHFSDWGAWEVNFSNFERLSIIYVGAMAMYFVGKFVSRKYNIKPNPRESLYDACDEWMKVVGKRKFHGNNKPDLADLSVYGALHSFEGCQAFKDLMSFHTVQQWYNRMEEQISQHQGAHLFSVPPSPPPTKK